MQNAMTMNDLIVVDGVVSSCFTDLGPLSIGFLRMAVLPLKFLHRVGLQCIVDLVERVAFMSYNYIGAQSHSTP